MTSPTPETLLALADGLTAAQRDWVVFEIHPFNSAARRKVRDALIRKGLLNFDSPPPIFTPLGLAVREVIRALSPEGGQ